MQETRSLQCEFFFFPGILQFDFLAICGVVLKTLLVGMYAICKDVFLAVLLVIVYHRSVPRSCGIQVA